MMRHLRLWVLALALCVPACVLASAAERELPSPPENAVTLTTARGATLTIDPEEFRIYDIPKNRFEEITGIPYEMQALDKPLGEIPPRMQTARSSTGLVLTVLIEWENHLADQFYHSAAAYDSLLYSDGLYPTGSVNDYYQEVSYGTFSVDGEVTGWHSMISPYDGWYDINEIVSIIDPVVNFNDYDGDGDGYVDAMWLIHAGPGQEETHNSWDIWSHAYRGAYVPTSDNVAINTWSMQPEEYANGDIVTIRVFAHEYGHILGLPDLYDYDEKLTQSTYSTPNDDNDHPLVDWDVMGYAGYNLMSYGTAECPTHFSAWCRTFLGWGAPEIPPCLDGTYQLYNVEEYSTQSIYKVPINDEGTEYFYLEYRNPHHPGIFDHLNSDFSAFFPWFTPGKDTLDSGLLITQIDETVSPNNGTPSRPNYAVRVVDAGYDPANPWDGTSEFPEWWHPYEFRIGALYSPDDPGQTLLSPTTTPSSDGYGGPSGITIAVIDQNADYMTIEIHRPYAPVIDAVAPVTLNDTTVEQVLLSASDENCTTPSFVMAGNPPPYAVVSDQGDGTAILTLSPTPGDAGEDTILVTAGDGDLADTAEVIVTVEATCNCPFHADFDANGLLDAIDLNAEIDALFFNGADPQDPSCPVSRADVNHDGVPNALDLNALIEHLFFGGPDLLDPCGP